ncbi:hypothetical protein IT570_10205 [Candidatus Sumerlaeota bacterium]|nr:hypothetical protein [Candidatus Sumerlaeota bacterium]
MLALLAQQDATGLAGFVEKYFSFIVLGLVMTVGYVVWRMLGTQPPKENGPTLEEAFQQAQEEIRHSRSEVMMQDEPVAELSSAPSPPPPIVANPEKNKTEQPPLEEA